MIRGTMHNAQMRQKQKVASNTLNIQHESSPLQQQHDSDTCESTAELNMCLDKYLKNLGYCAKKRHLHWCV